MVKLEYLLRGKIGLNALLHVVEGGEPGSESVMLTPLMVLFGVQVN